MAVRCCAEAWDGAAGSPIAAETGGVPRSSIRGLMARKNVRRGMQLPSTRTKHRVTSLAAFTLAIEPYVGPLPRTGQTGADGVRGDDTAICASSSHKERFHEPASNTFASRTDFRGADRNGLRPDNA